MAEAKTEQEKKDLPKQSEERFDIGIVEISRASLNEPSGICKHLSKTEASLHTKLLPL